VQICKCVNVQMLIDVQMCGYANVQMLKRLDILESFEVLKISKLFLFSGGCPILKYVVLYFICTFAYPHICTSTSNPVHRTSHPQTRARKCCGLCPNVVNDV
jgi:hypothetical protein